MLLRTVLCFQLTILLLSYLVDWKGLSHCNCLYGEVRTANMAVGDFSNRWYWKNIQYFFAAEFRVLEP